ncbi:hypothetical protein DFJ74DRAFT_718035, partial [Hyaloraphidium curvatum]
DPGRSLTGSRSPPGGTLSPEARPSTHRAGRSRSWSFLSPVVPFNASRRLQRIVATMSYAPPPGGAPGQEQARAAPAGAQVYAAPQAGYAAPPAGYAAPPAGPPPAQEVYVDPTALPAGWTTKKDETTNRWYFINPTGGVTWDDPRTVEVEQAPLDPKLREANKERIRQEMAAKMAAQQASQQQYAQPPQGYQQPPQGYAQPPQGYAAPPQGGWAPPPS